MGLAEFELLLEVEHRQQLLPIEVSGRGDEQVPDTGAAEASFDEVVRLGDLAVLAEVFGEVGFEPEPAGADDRQRGDQDGQNAQTDDMAIRPRQQPLEPAGQRSFVSRSLAIGVLAGRGPRRGEEVMGVALPGNAGHKQDACGENHQAADGHHEAEVVNRTDLGDHQRGKAGGVGEDGYQDRRGKLVEGGHKRPRAAEAVAALILVMDHDVNDRRDADHGDDRGEHRADHAELKMAEHERRIGCGERELHHGQRQHEPAHAVDARQDGEHDQERTPGVEPSAVLV